MNKYSKKIGIASQNMYDEAKRKFNKGLLTVGDYNREIERIRKKSLKVLWYSCSFKS